jgi:hypothetical protein
MAQNTSPIFELVPTVAGAQFTDADTTAKKTIQTGGANGSRVDAIAVSSSDTAAVNLAFYINNGAVDLYIGVVNAPIGSGYTTVVRVEAMTILSPVLRYLVLPSGYILKVACVATMTAAKVVNVVAIGGDY